MKAKPTKNTNLWRCYRITHVKVAWQERYDGKWHNHSKQLTREAFQKRFTQSPPNEPKPPVKPVIIGPGICDACGADVEELIVINEQPVAGVCACRSCAGPDWPK